jgi:citrate synthase
MKFRIKIDVGPSSYWSQITTMQTLDNLLQSEKITFLEYLDRLPAGHITNKQELIETRKQEDTRQQFIYEQMARFTESLPPEVQQMIQSIPPEEMEEMVMQLMMLPPEEQQQQIMQMMGVQPQGVMM